MARRTAGGGFELTKVCVMRRRWSRKSEGREARSGSGEEVVRDMNAAVTGDGEAPFSVAAMVDMGKEIDSVRPGGDRRAMQDQAEGGAVGR